MVNAWSLNLLVLLLINDLPMPTLKEQKEINLVKKNSIVKKGTKIL
jgi:hypothetical protein